MHKVEILCVYLFLGGLGGCFWNNFPVFTGFLCFAGLFAGNVNINSKVSNNQTLSDREFKKLTKLLYLLGNEVYLAYILLWRKNSRHCNDFYVFWHFHQYLPVGPEI